MVKVFVREVSSDTQGCSHRRSLKAPSRFSSDKPSAYGLRFAFGKSFGSLLSILGNPPKEYFYHTTLRLDPHFVPHNVGHNIGRSPGPADLAVLLVPKAAAGRPPTSETRNL